MDDLTTAISCIDRDTGGLLYRGYRIGDLASECSFEQVTYLLWHGELPGPGALRELTHSFAQGRLLSLPVTALLAGLPKQAPSMCALRTAISLLGALDPRADEEGEAANVAMACDLVAKLPALTATWHHLRRREDPIAPDPALGHAANFLYCLSGEVPDELSVRVLDACLTVHAEHGMNPSTLAARVTASTYSDVYSAVTAAVGALRGPLHGGANQHVLWMLDEIERPDQAASWVAGRLAEGRRVPGFGHRVYRGPDPRAAVLRDWCHKLAEHIGQPEWYDVTAAVEAAVLAQTGAQANVDFFSAPLYAMLGIEPDLFACVFASARIAGWVANILEQWQEGRPIRPLEVYMGPPPRDLP